MTAFPHYEVQKAVYTALVSSAALVSALPQGSLSISAYVQAGLDLPYVLIAQTASTPVLADEDGVEECSVTCEVASSHAGGTQARQLLGLVADALTMPITVVGYRVVMQQREQSRVELLPDGETYRGAFSMRLILQRTGG